MDGLKFGIPDMELRSFSGSNINPSAFAGHKLVVLFAPVDPDAAAEEIASYRRHSAKFVDCGTWLLAFADQDLAIKDGTRLLTIPDKERNAWGAFCALDARTQGLDRSSGAVFLFTRGGNLQRYWAGRGHVDHLLEELQPRSAERVDERAI